MQYQIFDLYLYFLSHYTSSYYTHLPALCILKVAVFWCVIPHASFIRVDGSLIIEVAETSEMLVHFH
jgi:hypothetical protein